MIRIEHLCKAYDGKPVLRDFSLTMESGEHLCLMGPSGCGKTTLLRLLMALERPDGGGIAGLDGLRMSAVFQEHGDAVDGRIHGNGLPANQGFALAKHPPARAGGQIYLARCHAGIQHGGNQHIAAKHILIFRIPARVLRKLIKHGPDQWRAGLVRGKH